MRVLCAPRLLDSAGEEFGEGINARKYQSMAKVSKATATRDLTDLVEKGCVFQLAGAGAVPAMPCCCTVTDWPSRFVTGLFVMP